MYCHTQKKVVFTPFGGMFDGICLMWCIQGVTALLAWWWKNHTIPSMFIMLDNFGQFCWGKEARLQERQAFTSYMRAHKFKPFCFHRIYNNFKCSQKLPQRYISVFCCSLALALIHFLWFPPFFKWTAIAVSTMCWQHLKKFYIAKSNRRSQFRRKITIFPWFCIPYWISSFCVCVCGCDCVRVSFVHLNVSRLAISMNGNVVRSFYIIIF